MTLSATKNMGAGGASSNRINFIASNQGSGTTVTYPTTILSGDIIIVGLYTYADTTGSAPATPSGFTRIGFAAAAPWNASPAYRVMSALYYKKSFGSDGATQSGFNFAADSGGGPTWVCAVYRPTFNAPLLATGDINQSNSTATEIITSSAANASFKSTIAMFAWATYAPSVFCSMSPTPSTNVQIAGANGGNLLAVGFNQSAAVDATVTQGSGSFGVAHVSAYLALA